MAVNVARWLAAGFDRLHYTVLDGAGYATGTSTSLTAGSNSAAGRLWNVNTANVSVPDPRVVPVSGDDALAGTFIFPSDAAMSFTIEASEFDQTFRALAESTVRQQLGDITWTPIAPKDPAYRSMGMILTSKAIVQDSGAQGVPGYQHLLINKCTVTPLGTGGLANATAQSNRYTVTVNLSDIYLWGSALSDANNGTTATHMLDGQAENWLTIHALTGNNSATTLVLAQTPAEASADKVRVYVNGTALTYTTDYTVDVATKTITFNVAPASGAKVVVVYEYV